MQSQLRQLASAQPWESARLRQLKGHCVGSVMKNWASNVRARWGIHAEQQIRDILGEDSLLLPSAPTSNDRFPAYLQIWTTDIIIAQFLHGDALALEELLWEDSLKNTQSASLKLLQWTGPAVLLRQAGHIHKRLYDIGYLDTKVGWKHAQLTYQDAVLFDNPTWQLLQLFAFRLFLRTAGRTVTQLKANQPKPHKFQVQIAWTR